MTADRAPLDDMNPGALVAALLAHPAPGPRISEMGQVAEIADGIAVVTGLERSLSDEVLNFASGVQGLVLDLEPGRLGVVLLGPSAGVTLGESVTHMQGVVSVAVGHSLMERVVDALGRPRDGKGPVKAEARQILERLPISRPFATGIKVIDAALSVGLGQRELTIGDRQTDKTSVAVDAILNQKNTDVLCIYCAVGQQGDAVAKGIGALDRGGMMARSIVMSAGDDEAAGLGYIAPYAAMTMAEHFAMQGLDVLVVLDDLTHHARSYRELSLLLRRPPGGEAFPGDIFHIHARLLERAGLCSPKAQGAGRSPCCPSWRPKPKICRPIFRPT